MTSPLAFAGLSSRGLVRARNEDNWLADPARGLFVVADGMGSHNAGAIAFYEKYGFQAGCIRMEK